MAEYHVNRNTESNRIFAGRLNKERSKWISASDVTDECLIAVRDHFLAIMAQERLNGDDTKELGFLWKINDDKDVITLKVVIENANEVTINEK